MRAAGAVLWRPGDGARGPAAGNRDIGIEVALVHRPRYDDWSLPKGKLDPGETEPVAAVREIAEETGYRAVLGPFLRRIRYSVTRKRDLPPRRAGRVSPKVVDYFAARAVDGAFRANAEVDELRWLPLGEAEALLSYPGDREVLAAFRALPYPLTSVLLIRHAEAGSRDEWPGEDDLRPLTPAGKAQAEALRELLPLFGVDRVYSAPPLRCAQTVRGLAEDLGTPIRQEPLLGEKGYLQDPAASEARLLEIAATGGTPVVSSQGGVIPALVAGIAEHDGLALGEVHSRKGSLWVLSFVQPKQPDGNPGSGGTRPTARPRLVAAHYIPTALAESSVPVRRANPSG
ncbi:NUDIX hydrolase [Gandjariella thermophila]|uniref:NUDIX hydrolase n=1 Tax=Gandjariella thermophila TaxID=1931992 RepID=UPI0010F5D21C